MVHFFFVFFSHSLGSFHFLFSEIIFDNSIINERCFLWFFYCCSDCFCYFYILCRAMNVDSASITAHTHTHRKIEILHKSMHTRVRFGSDSLMNKVKVFVPKRIFHCIFFRLVLFFSHCVVAVVGCWFGFSFFCFVSFFTSCVCDNILPLVLVCAYGPTKMNKKRQKTRTDQMNV